MEKTRRCDRADTPKEMTVTLKQLGLRLSGGNRFELILCLIFNMILLNFNEWKNPAFIDVL